MFTVFYDKTFAEVYNNLSRAGGWLNICTGDLRIRGHRHPRWLTGSSTMPWLIGVACHKRIRPLPQHVPRTKGRRWGGGIGP